MTPFSRYLRGLRGNEPVIVVAFDATSALCVLVTGELEYADHRDVRIFFEDHDVEYWYAAGEQIFGTNGAAYSEQANALQPEGASESASTSARPDGRVGGDVAESSSGSD